MKKMIILLSTLILTCIGISSVSANNSIEILIDGIHLETDVAPIIINDRTLLLIRTIVESIGGNVDWDNEKRQALISKDGTEIVITLDETLAIVNGEEFMLDVPAQLVDNRTMVPVRFVAETLGLKVDYADNIVYIETELIKNDIEINSNASSKDYTYYVNEVFDEITSRIRERGTTGETETLDYLVAELNSFGYDTELQHFDIYETSLSTFFDNFWELNILGNVEPLITSHNLIASKNYDENKKTIVFSAHYDTSKDSIGAVDNASGVTVLLESARLIAEYTENLDYNIEIVFFGSEEYYLTGSRSYILSLSEEKFDNIIGNFNIDMTSTNKWRKLLLDGCRQTSFYDEFMRIYPDFEVIELGLSDEASFSLSHKEIPSFRFTTVNMLDYNFDPSILGKETENNYVDYEFLKIDADIVFGFMKNMIINNIL